MALIQTTSAFRAVGETISSSVINIQDISGWQSGDMDSAEIAIVTARGGGVMYRFDGGAPTTDLGHFIAADSNVEIRGSQNIANLKFIRAGLTNASLTITLKK